MRWLNLLSDFIGAVVVFVTPLLALYLAYGFGLT